jgi:glutamyl-tRNA reductase
MPLLERLTVDREARPVVLKELKRQLGLTELVYLATCNRVEFLYTTSDESVSAGRILHRLIDFFLSRGPRVNFFPNDFYYFQGREALIHLFRTVSSLESLVVGETQITGQFKNALQEAEEHGLCGSVLSQLGREALLVARRVKRETAICQGALSMASLASEVLDEQLHHIERPRVILAGVGDMTVKLAQYLRKNGRAELVFVNRTETKAKELAARFAGSAMTLSDFIGTPGRVDAIFSATAASQAVFDEHFLEALTADNKQVVCIDLAIPRDFCAAFDSHPRIALFDIPRLKARGNQHLRQKFIEAEKANRIIREEVNRYLARCYEVSLKPIFTKSYQESLAIAQKALQELFARRLPELKPEQQEHLQRLVTNLIGQATYHPMRNLSNCLIEWDHPLELQPRQDYIKQAI